MITLSTQGARNLILEMAATCASGRKWPPAISCLWQPFAATRVAASGRLTSASHGNFSTFSAANPHSERQGKTHNENAQVQTKMKE